MAGILVRAALVGVATLAVAGCSAAGPGDGVESASPAARNVRTAPKVMTLGTIGVLRDKDGNPEATVQVTDVQPKADVPAGVAGKGKQIATIEAKACDGALSQPGNIDWGPFALTLGDSTLVEALDSWSDSWFTEPLFPQSRTIQPGDCVKGLVPFAIPKGAQPVRVEFQAVGGDTLLWSAGG